MYNNFTILGRTTKDVEVRLSNNGVTMAKFSIASTSITTKNNERIENTLFIDALAIGKIGDVAEKYLKKGNLVFITGKLQNDDWTDSNGVKHHKITLLVSELKLIPQGQKNATTTKEASQVNNTEPVFEFSDDEIPF